jgi:hypothetical protein
MLSSEMPFVGSVVYFFTEGNLYHWLLNWIGDCCVSLTHRLYGPRVPMLLRGWMTVFQRDKAYVYIMDLTSLLE